MKNRHRIAVIVTCAAAALPVAGFVAPAANAATGKVVTSGVNLYVRSGPGTSYSVVGSLAPGSAVSFTCYEQGTAVTGPYGTETIWDQLNSGGFVSDAWIYTGSNNATVPECSNAPAIPNSQYNRTAAIAWALANAKDPQAYGAMCTWFVSNALWAGGFPKSSLWTNQGKYYSAPGTKDAWRVQDFLSYFQAHFSTTLTNITADFKTNAVPQAAPGDIILYDWGQGEGISHATFVVDLAPGDYPEVAEWGQYDLNPLDAAINKVVHIKSTYLKRGWTWSAVHGEWLQKEFPHVKAYLLHINGGYLAPSF
jgi:Putative amidase domain